MILDDTEGGAQEVGDRLSNKETKQETREQEEEIDMRRRSRRKRRRRRSLFSPPR